MNDGPEAVKISDLNEAQCPPWLSAEQWRALLEEFADVVIGHYSLMIVELMGPLGRRRIMVPRFVPSEEGMNKVRSALMGKPTEAEPSGFVERDPDWWKNGQ